MAGIQVQYAISILDAESFTKRSRTCGAELTSREVLVLDTYFRMVVWWQPMLFCHPFHVGPFDVALPWAALPGHWPVWNWVNTAQYSVPTTASRGGKQIAMRS